MLRLGQQRREALAGLCRPGARYNLTRNLALPFPSYDASARWPVSEIFAVIRAKKLAQAMGS